MGAQEIIIRRSQWVSPNKALGYRPQLAGKKSR